MTPEVLFHRDNILNCLVFNTVSGDQFATQDILEAEAYCTQKGFYGVVCMTGRGWLGVYDIRLGQIYEGKLYDARYADGEFRLVTTMDVPTTTKTTKEPVKHDPPCTESA